MARTRAHLDRVIGFHCLVPCLLCVPLSRVICNFIQTLCFVFARVFRLIYSTSVSIHHESIRATVCTKFSFVSWRGLRKTNQQSAAFPSSSLSHVFVLYSFPFLRAFFFVLTVCVPVFLYSVPRHSNHCERKDRILFVNRTRFARNQLALYIRLYTTQSFSFSLSLSE